MYFGFKTQKTSTGTSLNIVPGFSVLYINTSCRNGFLLWRQIQTCFSLSEFRPGRKLEKLRNLEKTGNFFPRFLNPSFRFWPYGKIENLEIRKLGTIFSRFPRFPSFRFANFSFFKNLLSVNILQYAIPYFLSMLCIVFKAF